MHIQCLPSTAIEVILAAVLLTVEYWYWWHIQAQRVINCLIFGENVCKEPLINLMII